MSADNLIIEGQIVKGFKCESSHIIIPEGITEISEGAFKDCTWVNEVTIESSTFRTIGKNAFSGCSSLEKITMKSLRGAVGDQAFFDCSKLGIVDIPLGAMEIGNNAFGACQGLYLVRIPDSVMVIAEDAFDAYVSKMLLIVCQPNTEAEKYAERKHIPHRGTQELYQIKNRLESANKYRKLVATRVFTMFGQSITVPNSLALKESVLSYYDDTKDRFFELVFNRIPKSYAGKSELYKVGEDFLQYASIAVARLEERGVYTTQLHVLRNAGQILESVPNTLNSINEIIQGLANMRDSHLEDRINQLRNEAESKVTGLSYGVVGDSLTLALHAVDDFRARQNQRSEAYAVAQQKYDQEAAQTNAIINQNYKKILENNIRPLMRTLTDAYMGTLCAAEISLLSDYGLLEDIDVNAFDAKKSSEIIAHAASMDKEYSVGLALKTYPLNVQALAFAGRNNLATKETLDYITFMQISDLSVIANVLQSKKISLEALVGFHNYTPSAGVCKLEIQNRIEPVKQRISAMISKEECATAEELQKQIAVLISCELWIAVNEITPVLPTTILKVLGATQQEVSTERGYHSLGQRINAYNSKLANATTEAETIVATNISIQEKITALKELFEVLGTQNIRQLLRDELVAIGEKVIQEPLPEYTGMNTGVIKQVIKRKLEESLGCETVSNLKAMLLNEFTPEVWANTLQVKYANEQKAKYASQLKDSLQSVDNYCEAFNIAKQYMWRIERSVLREMMEAYTEMATNDRNRIADLIEISESTNENDAKALSIKAMHDLMVEECWLVYYLCAFTTLTDPKDIKEQLESTVYADAEELVWNEIIYRDACAMAQTAKNAKAALLVKKRFEKIRGNYKDCSTRIVECDEKIVAYTKKKTVVTSSIAISSVALVLAFVIVLCTVIIPNIKYNDAVAMMEAGKYTEAIYAFREIDKYKDSKNKIQECYYSLGLIYLDEGNHPKAAFAFGYAGSYSDARKQAAVLWNEIAVRQSIACGEYHTLGLKTNGTVVATGYNDFGQCNVSGWTDIIALSAGPRHTVGLKTDGTVVATGYNDFGECNVSGWTDIVAISAGSNRTVGLKADGTVVAINGNVSDWRNIVAISAGSAHIVGLKADGTLVATGINDEGQCNVSGWTDIVAISAGYSHTVGLTADGTVVATGDNSHGECNVSTWTDIIAISAGMYYTVGLKADGTVVATGENLHHQCDVSNWSDIVAISAGNWHTVAVKRDGTVIATGSNDHRECNVSAWKNIKGSN